MSSSDSKQQQGQPKNFPIRPPEPQSSKKMTNTTMATKKATTTQVQTPKKEKTSPKRHFSVSDCQGYWYIYAPHWEVRTSNLIQCLETTFVKRTTQYSWELPEHEKREVHQGFQIRVSYPPAIVADKKEKSRHKWTHLHRQIHLGDYERCKAELIEAKVRLMESQRRLEREKVDEKALKDAKRELAIAKADLEREMAERKRLGLSIHIDPFDESFSTGVSSSSSPSVVVDDGDETKKKTKKKTCYFVACGAVQGVMFRQTLIRGARKRNLRAGATNLDDGRSVAITLLGDPMIIESFANEIKSKKELNSWGARVDSWAIVEEGKGKDIAIHQVTTENVDTFAWDTSVKMFL
jgi:acylphosphatase